jgi:hypothetical protein
MTMARGRSWFTILVLCFSAGVSLMMLFVAVAQWTGLDPARDGEAATGGVMVAIMTGTMAVAGVFLTRPRKPPSLAETIQTIELVQLAKAEEALSGLLHKLDDSPSGLLDRTWNVASVAAGRFRLVAAKVIALVEVDDLDPPAERAIQYRVGTLSALLDEVFAAYQAVVAAALVLLEDPSAGAELVRATDHLANLTEGLHEISALDQTDPR